MVKIRKIKNMNNYKYSINGSTYSNFVTPHIDTNNINIAIIQPGSWGDNINSTMMLTPLKNKYPTSQIDIYTTKQYASAFYNNHLIDNIITADIEGKNDSLNFVHVYPPLLENKGYTHIINASPFINPNDWSSGLYPQLGENLMLSWCKALEKINVHYDLPLKTMLIPTTEELANVNKYIDENLAGEKSSKFKVLLEVEGESGQSFWDTTWTIATVDLLINKGFIAIVSKKYLTHEIEMLQKRYPSMMLFAGNLSIRECSVLYNHCDAFFSISSGLSNACNTHLCSKSQKWIETVNSKVPSSEPLRSEGKIFWHDNNLERFIKFINSYSWISS